ncbi:MAG: hypothetical protein LBT43_23205 [Prevotella sp.]|jgi:hypothetical protein|nr:hypothetical protein [Prevotella sp.]
MNDTHSKFIPPDILERVQRLIDEANNLLAPYIYSLTPKERHEILKMGNRSVGFVKKVFDYARHYPQFCPSYLDLDAFEIDVKDATGLRVVNISAHQLADNIDDTSMIAGSEALQAALIFYSAVKTAAEQDIPGAKEIYNDLKAHFPRKKHKKKE